MDSHGDISFHWHHSTHDNLEHILESNFAVSCKKDMSWRYCSFFIQIPYINLLHVHECCFKSPHIIFCTLKNSLNKFFISQTHVMFLNKKKVMKTILILTAYHARKIPRHKNELFILFHIKAKINAAILHD